MKTSEIAELMLATGALLTGDRKCYHSNKKRAKRTQATQRKAVQVRLW